MSLQITAQPIAEPVTVAEVKARLRLSTSADDSVIASNITTAREYAESVTGWSFAGKTYRLTRDSFPFPHEAIKLPRPPLVSVTSVKYLDSNYVWQTWDSAEYFVVEANVPALIVPKTSFIYPPPVSAPGAVRIDFVAGAQAHTPHLEGIRQLAVHIYEHPSVVSSEGLKEIPLAISAFFLGKRVYGF